MFALILALLLGAFYAYAVWSLDLSWGYNLLLSLPFLTVWLVPVLYWGRRTRRPRWYDHGLHLLSYVSMGWLSFFYLFLLIRDGIGILSHFSGASALENWMDVYSSWLVIVSSLLALIWGMILAWKGPAIREVDIRFSSLPHDLDGFRIAQISDLHVGPTIGRDYVQEVVRKVRSLAPDLIVLTGDIVDGRVEDLRRHLEPLTQLEPHDRLYLVLGNHDYYSGASAWTPVFRELGFKVLLNEHDCIDLPHATLMVAGVLDPAARIQHPSLRPDPSLALQRGPEARNGIPLFRLLLAHNPQIAMEAAQQGFDLQLSGHTHAGQFIPWTLVTRMVHAPHYVGLSREGSMWVYVNPGTGSWGPPIRLGTRTELTLIQLRSDHSSS